MTTPDKLRKQIELILHSARYGAKFMGLVEHYGKLPLKHQVFEAAGMNYSNQQSIARHFGSVRNMWLAVEACQQDPSIVVGALSKSYEEVVVDNTNRMDNTIKDDYTPPWEQ